MASNNIRRSRPGAGLQWCLLTYLWAVLPIPLMLSGQGMPAWLAALPYHGVGTCAVGTTWVLGWLFYRADKYPTRDQPHQPVGTGRRQDYTWMVTVPTVLSILCYLLLIARQSQLTALVIDYVKKIVA